MTLTDFTHLKTQLATMVECSETYPELLETLKTIFINEIDSPRRLERITTIFELFHVLDMRGLLHEDNIIALRKIANTLPNNKQILCSLEKYEEIHVVCGPYNHFADENNTGNGSRSIQTSSHRRIISNEKREIIYQTLKEEIGSYWRDLGRYLGIRENKLDEINSSCNEINQKVTKLLEIYDLKADPHRWFHTLCEALDESRRKDLRRELEKIMLSNY